MIDIFTYLPKKIKPFKRKHWPVRIKSFLDLPKRKICEIEREKQLSIKIHRLPSVWIFSATKRKVKLAKLAIIERERERDLEQRMKTRWRQQASLKPRSQSSEAFFSFGVTPFIKAFVASIVVVPFNFLKTKKLRKRDWQRDESTTC